MVTGGCHCGAVRYEAAGDPVYSALCHCSDCRKSAGAPMVGWALFPKDKVSVTGEVASYASSEHATRQFCARCGTGLFYLNEMIFPGQIDIQTATLADRDPRRSGRLSARHSRPICRSRAVDGRGAWIAEV